MGAVVELRETGQSLHFDQVNQSIGNGVQSWQLSPKAYAVLACLFQRAGQLVTKDELLTAAWPDVFVVEGVLKNTVRELRELLGDDARAPRFIETVHRRGYRFIGADRLIDGTASPALRGVAGDAGDRPVGCERPGRSQPFSRRRELQALLEHWNSALAGVRRGIVVSGEPGTGKSTLIGELHARGDWQADGVLVVRQRTTRSRNEHPYVGFLDALDQLCTSSRGEHVQRLLARYAPTWRAWLPWLSAPTSTSVPGAMPRTSTLFLEAAVFLEAVAGEAPLLLMFDDVHLGDSASRDLLEYICARESPARLMVVVTQCAWRAAQADGARFDSDMRGQPWTRIELGPLELASVASESMRFEDTKSPTFARLRRAHERTGGHPLCMHAAMATLDELVHDTDTLTTVPDAFVARMRCELDALGSDGRRLLQLASIAATRAFSAGAVSSLLDLPVVDAEAQLDELATRGLWIRRAGARRWPDGTFAQAYRFTFPVYRELHYHSLSVAHRQQLHLRHALRVEAAYDSEIVEVANNLAYHFERGGESGCAARYRQLQVQSESGPISRPRPDLRPLVHSDCEHRGPPHS